MLRSPVLVLAPAILLAAGFWVGRIWQQEQAATGTPSGNLTASLDRKPSSSVTGPAGRPVNPQLRGIQDFLQRLEQTSAAEFPALWEEWHAQNAKTSQPLGGSSIEELLMANRWAELDPAAASAFFGKSEAHASLLNTVFGVWGRSDADAAAAAIKGIEKGPLRSAALDGVVLSALNDPPALNAWFRRLAQLDKHILGGWNFPEALTPERLGRAFDLDPAASRELAALMGEKFGLRLEALSVLRAAATDLPGALAMIEALPFDAKGDIGDRATRFFTDLSSLADSDPDKVIALMEGLNAKFGKGWLNGNNEVNPLPVIEALAKAAPHKIRALLGHAFPIGNGTAIIREECARNLFETNPRAALEVAPGGDAWVLDFIGGKFTFPDFSSLPVPPLELLRDAPASSLRDALLRASLPDLAKRSPEAAAEWAASLPEGDFRTLATSLLQPGGGPSDLESAAFTAAGEGANSDSLLRVQGIALRLTITDPASATAQISSLPPGPARDAALEKTGETWAGRSTPDALAWASALPDDSREHALAGILKPWVENEPAAAWEFIAALPAGSGRDLPVRAFATGLAPLDPEAALQWAATMENAEQRQATLTEIAPSLFKNHPEEAGAIIQGLQGLSDEERQQILKAAPPP